MSNTPNSASKIWTPANIITLLRICLVPVFVIALLSHWPLWFGISDIINDQIKAIIAACVFVIISCTDWIDGYLARSRGEVTDFGKLIDPLADKILVAAALIALVELQVLPSWPVLIILTREFIVSGIRMLAASKGFVIAASWYGKAKTVLQIIAIVLFIVKDSLYLPNIDAVAEHPLYIISWLVMFAALVMTVLSMLDYIAKARPLLFPKGKVESDIGINVAETAKIERGGNYNASELYSEIEKLASEIIEKASAKKLTIGCAESLTGGLISSALTSISGASSVFSGGIVSYTYEVKSNLLNVDKSMLAKDGAVNESTAKEMAESAAYKLDVDIAVSVTGIAGPGGAEVGKPVGTVFMGLYKYGEVFADRFEFSGNREEVRLKTVYFALDKILKSIS